MPKFHHITESNFEDAALQLFRRQFAHNPVYREYCTLIGVDPSKVSSLCTIPFLPISLFKSHEVKSGLWEPQLTFTSSATTGSVPSKHHVCDLEDYKKAFHIGFEYFYGKPEEWTIVALLPSYLEREGSSLVLMVQELMNASRRAENGFYLTNVAQLREQLVRLKETKQKTLLIGVSFALLDFAAEGVLDFPELVIMETGGMKGRRKEMVRAELHSHLAQGFPSSAIHSEYGMTELFSQAYRTNLQRFACPPWMRVYTRDITDPLSTPVQNGSRGALNIIDLANTHSCAFIATQDSGIVWEDGTFEVYGRVDQSEIRGCNLMVW